MRTSLQVQESSNEGRPPNTLELPPFPRAGLLGEGIAQRAISLTLVTMCALAVATIIALIFVTVDLSVEGKGVLEAARTWEVRSQSTGILREVFVATGDSVKRGQSLIRLDSVAVAAHVAELQNEYHAQLLAYERTKAAMPIQQQQKQIALLATRAKQVSARASLRDEITGMTMRTDIDLDSLLRAYKPGKWVRVDNAVAAVMASAADSATAVTDLHLADLTSLDLQRQQSQMNQVLEQIRVGELDLRRLLLRAPVDGIVSTEHVERLVGTAVKEGDQILEIGERSGWRAELAVSQSEISEVRLDDPAEIEILGFRRGARQLLRGHVVAIAVKPTSGSSAAVNGDNRQIATQYRVTVEVDPSASPRDEPSDLRMGYSVKGRIITGSGRLGAVIQRYLRRSA
jgi:multidrug resistance efflux pump